MIKKAMISISKIFEKIFKKGFGFTNPQSDWTNELQCNRCGSLLDLPYGGGCVQYTCPRCKKKFTVTSNEISYAVAESGSNDYRRYNSDQEIEVRCFRNCSADLLEEAWQDLQGLNEEEKDPHKLLPIVKKYHDAVKGHGRRLLEVHPGSLTQGEVQIIKKDNDRWKKLNVKNLFDYLKKAYPAKSVMIDCFYSSNKALIERLWWVRNKQEHILYSQWSMNAKVFEDLNRNPDDLSVSPDNLNTDFIKRANNLSVDIYRLIIDLRPTGQEQWQYLSVEQFRL